MKPPAADKLLTRDEFREAVFGEVTSEAAFMIQVLMSEASKDPKHIRRMALRDERNEAGMCAYCGLLPKEEGRRGCKDCGKGHVRENSAFSRARKDRTALYRKRTKKKVIDKYGGVCACCSEAELNFLTIDHIEGNGHEDQRLHGGGTGWYFELLRSPRRSDLQVLCYNCNMGRELNGGICPHLCPTPKDLWTSDLRRIKRFNKGCKYNWPGDAELVERYQKLGPAKAAAAIGATADALLKRLVRRGFKTFRSRADREV